MDDLSSKLSIDTPENILLDVEIAGFGTRCIAALADYLILIVLFSIVTYLFARALSTTGVRGSGAVAALVLIQFILVTGYHLLFELLWNGQTPGKRLTGIRVVLMNGMPVTTSSTIIRNLVRLLDFLPILYGLGL
ncbi:MAG TPA: RDD family protein, partial [Aggregatilineaceae bacterium]|nr:RDD family protein [Aggregatilineaceae bacterium]